MTHRFRITVQIDVVVAEPPRAGVLPKMTERVGNMARLGVAVGLPDALEITASANHTEPRDTEEG